MHDCIFSKTKTRKTLKGKVKKEERKKIEEK
jgi:hypothetical protein